MSTCRLLWMGMWPLPDTPKAAGKPPTNCPRMRCGVATGWNLHPAPMMPITRAPYFMYHGKSSWGCGSWLGRAISDTNFSVKDWMELGPGISPRCALWLLVSFVRFLDLYLPFYCTCGIGTIELQNWISISRCCCCYCCDVCKYFEVTVTRKLLNLEKFNCFIWWSLLILYLVIPKIDR